jgi:hypothetical protein
MGCGICHTSRKTTFAAETDTTMRHKRNLPSCLLSGLGTATVLLAGCMNSQTSRDGLLTPLWPNYSTPLSKNATTSGGGSTATLSDANSVATTFPSSNAPVPRVIRRKVAESKSASTSESPSSSGSSGVDSSATAAASPSPAPVATTSSPPSDAQTPTSQPDSPLDDSPPDDNSSVQLVSAESSLPESDSTSNSTSESTPSPAPESSAQESPSGQPESSRLSDFVEPNRVTPRSATEQDGSATAQDEGIASEGPGTNPSSGGRYPTTFTSITEGESDDQPYQEGASEGTNSPSAPSSERLARNIPSTSKGQEAPELDSDSWEEHLEQSIEGLRRQLATADLDERERARLEGILRLMYIAANRQEDALASLDQLSPQQQKFWRSGVAGLLELLSPPSDTTVSRQAKLALRHLRSACHELAVMASLEVRNLAFCRRVESFGRYTEFEPYEFFPEQEVILYAEVGNFIVEEVDDGYESELLGSYQIFDESGRHVGDYDLPLDKQVSRHIRTDYFLPYRVYLPRALAEGNYTIQVTMQDKKGKKFGQTEPVPFRIRHE